MWPSQASRARPAIARCMSSPTSRTSTSRSAPCWPSPGLSSSTSRSCPAGRRSATTAASTVRRCARHSGRRWRRADAATSAEETMRRFHAFRPAFAGLALLACALAPPARAQEFPSRKITFMVGFAPGGGIDTFARVIAQALGEHFGWQIVVENRAGAASNIAAKLVASVAPDGYTLLFTGNSYAINQTLYKNPGYATEDLAPVAFVALDSQAFAVNADNPARSLNELLGHHVDVNVGPVAEVHPMIQQGAVRALAVTGPRRAAALPDVPTLDEIDMRGLGINGWIGLLTPAKTPLEIRAKLNAAINEVAASPDVDRRLRTLGYEPYRGSIADAPAFLKTQIDTWGALIRATGISAE